MNFLIASNGIQLIKLHSSQERSFRIFPKMRGEISVLLTDFAKRSVNGGEGGGSETSSLFCQCGY